MLPSPPPLRKKHRSIINYGFLQQMDNNSQIQRGYSHFVNKDKSVANIVIFVSIPKTSLKF